MEKKTMGSFIAALRKANGLTQKDLAEKLNVSDKAVSRWERDENAPDLSLIPVIADIFGITADELLRGERRKPADTTGVVADTFSENGNSEEAGGMDNSTSGGVYSYSTKSEKQIKYLINKVEYDFRIKNYIDYLIVLVSVIAAAICNFGVKNGMMGFVIGTAVLVVAVVCEFMFYSMCSRSLSSEEFPEEMTKTAKNKIFVKIKHTLLIEILWFLSMIPLCFVPEGWSFILLAWLIYGGGVALIGFAIYYTFSPSIDMWAVRRGINYLSEADELNIHSKIKNIKSFYKKAGIIVIADIIIIALMVVWESKHFSKYDYVHFDRMDNIEGFVQYMEEMGDDTYDIKEKIEEKYEDYVDSEYIFREEEYFEEKGEPYLNEKGVYVTKEIEEILKVDANALDDYYEECVDENGNVIFAYYNMCGAKYISYGKLPGLTEYDNKEGKKYLPIYFCTRDEAERGEKLHESRVQEFAINSAIVIIIFEVAVSIVVMVIKRTKNGK